MKHSVHGSLEKNKLHAFNLFLTVKNIHEPLRENDIIFLHDKFLTNGFLNLHVKDIYTGRSIISKILNSMNYHNDIAILTDDTKNNKKLIKNYFDINKKLVDDYNIKKNEIKIIDFFLEKFYFDFLLIELTTNLAAKNWIQKFEQHILDFNFHKTIPIIILTYDMC